MMLRALLFAVMLSAASLVHAQETARPATVVVAFDRETVTPLIAEGIADRETGRLVQANDPVRIASISKLIMAMATLRLMDEGSVDLDADVADYLGWALRNPHHPDAKVTLAHLLSHRSGLRDDAGYVIPLGESLRDKLSDPAAWVDAPPGNAPFKYANLGSPVVATVLEAATGERFDQLVERTVFAPLGIKACLNWIGCGQDQIDQAVVLYRNTGEVARDDAADLPPNCTIPVVAGSECSLENYVPGTNASVFSPQGGVRIGMMDLARFGQAALPFTTGFVSSSAHHEIVVSLVFGSANEGESFFCDYGLAMHQIEAPESECQDNLFDDGLTRIGHAGEAYGLRSGLWFSRATNRGLAYFTTAVPPRQSAEDEGGFDPREIALVRRVQALLAQQNDE